MPNSASSSHVSGIMTQPPITIGQMSTIADAGKLMVEHNVGSLIVCENDKVIGILTERDLLRFSASGAQSAHATVSEWMTLDPDTVEPDTEVTKAWQTLSEHGYRHIPVVKDRVLFGVVSMRDLLRVAQIRPVSEPAIDVPRGLEGVIAAETSVGGVRGREGFYHYREYSAVDLAHKRSLEDVWCLLFEGFLPDRVTEEYFAEKIRDLREIPESVKQLLPEIVRVAPRFVPLDALRSAISLLAQSLEFKPWLDIDQDMRRKNAIRICAVTPSLLTALYRLHQGQDPIDPHPHLRYAANYLYMLTGEVPDPEHARAIEQYLISTVDHGFNASTFSARVITSTGTDLGAAVIGAIAALSGPLHGGAPSRALDMLDAIGTSDRAEGWIREAVSKGERIMGFGHRVYKTEDPRSLLLRDIAERLGGEMFEFAREVEGIVVSVLAELKPNRELYTNVEFYAGVVMEKCGIPREMFTPTFTSSRMIGWCAHILEQAADNRLIRPSSRYVGVPPPQEIPSIDH